MRSVNKKTPPRQTAAVNPSLYSTRNTVVFFNISLTYGFPLPFGKANLGAQPSPLEDRLQQATSNRPDEEVAVQQVNKFIARSASGSGETQGGKE